MSLWKIVVEICLPIPIVLLALLCFPAPRVFHRGVLKVVDSTLGIQLIGNNLRLLHFMLVVSGAAFLATIRTTYQLKDQHLDPSSVTPNVLSANLGKRWRAERNFWIAFITFTLWCLLARFYQILKQKAQIEDNLDRLRGDSPAKSSGPAPTKPDPVVRKPDPVVRKSQ